jgi:hypothetical protein
MGLGFKLRASLAKQALYSLSRSSVHFALVILEMGVFWPRTMILLISVSQFSFLFVF